MLEKATQKITEWLKHMGLVLSPKKTRVTHTLTPYEGNVGFDFLGYTVRQFYVGKPHTGKDTNGQPLGYKTINAPSQKSQQNTHPENQSPPEEAQVGPTKGCRWETEPSDKGVVQLPQSRLRQESLSSM